MNKKELEIIEAIGYVVSLKSNILQQQQQLTELVLKLDELHNLLIKKIEMVKNEDN